MMILEDIAVKDCDLKYENDLLSPPGRKNMVESFLILAMIALVHPLTLGATPKDSTSQSETRVRTYNYGVRVQSHGFSPFSGYMANGVVADVFGSTEFKRLGVFVMKAADLSDRHSPFNFSIALFYYKLPRVGRFTFRPQACLIIGQRYKLVDRGSDAAFIMTTSYTISEHYSVEHAATFLNCLLKTENFDWLNRLSFVYANNKAEIAARVWHKNHVFNSGENITFGISASYNRIRISRRCVMNISATGICQRKFDEVATQAWKKSGTLSIAVSVR